MDNQKLNRYLFWFIKIGILIIMFVPFIVGSKFFFPFIVLKNVVFRVVVELIFLAYVILILREPKYRLRLNWLTLSVFIFFIILILTSFTGIGLDRSLWGNYERMGGIVRWLHVLMFFVAVAGVFQSKKDWFDFFTFSVFTSFLISFFGFAQKLNIPFILSSSGGSRLTGTIGNASYLAAYLIFNIFFLIYFLIRDKLFNLKLFFYSIIGADIVIVLFDIYQRYSAKLPAEASLFRQISAYPRLLWSLILIQVVVFGAYFLRRNRLAAKTLIGALLVFELLILYWTETRGAVIGFLIGIFILAVLNIRNLKSPVVKKSVYGAIACLILVPALLYSFQNKLNFVKNNPTLKRLVSISTQNVSTHNRLLVWNASLRSWVENPIHLLLGVGQENYYYIFNKKFPPEIFEDLGSRIWFDRAHNIVIDTGATAGLIGLLSYLSIFVIALLFLWRRYLKQPGHLINTILISLLVAYFIQNFFVFDTLNTIILFFLVLGYMYYLWQIEDHSKIVLTIKNFLLKLKKPALAGNYLIIAAVSLVTVWGLFTNYRLLRANNYLFQALKIDKNSAENIEQIANLYLKSINEAVTGRYEAREQLANFALQVVNKTDIENYVKYNVLNQTLAELKKSIQEEPTHVRHYLYYASIVNRATIAGFQNPRDAIAYLTQAISLSPTRPQVYFELGQAYFLERNFEDGLKNFKKGAELSPKVIDSHIDLAVAYIVSGNPDKGKEEIEYARQNLTDKLTDQQYLRVIKTLENIKNYNLLAEIYELYSQDYPQNPEIMAQMALAYALAGQSQQAIDIANSIIEINSAYATDTKKFIKKVKAGDYLKAAVGN